MQVKKDSVKRKIIKIATEEFIKNGFQKSSLREISRKAEVTKGSIYTYFKSKDDLFCEAAKPGVDLFKKVLSSNFEEMDKDEIHDYAYSYERSTRDLKYHANLFMKYSNEIRLLFYCSEGTSLSNYRSTIARLYQEQFMLFIDKIAGYNQTIVKNTSYLFMHTCAQLYLGFIEEIIYHEPDDEDIEKYLDEMSKFLSGGYRKVFGYEE